VVEIGGHRLGEAPRTGEILEVLGHPQGHACVTRRLCSWT
jgi:hypothetical protein